MNYNVTTQSANYPPNCGQPLKSGMVRFILKLRFLPVSNSNLDSVQFLSTRLVLSVLKHTKVKNILCVLTDYIIISRHVSKILPFNNINNVPDIYKCTFIK